MLWSWAAAESTGKQFQTAWQTAVSHSNNNPSSQWKRAGSVRAAQPEVQQWKQGIRGCSEWMAQVSGPPISRREPFHRAATQQGLERNCRWGTTRFSTTLAKTCFFLVVFCVCVFFFWRACIHAAFTLTYKSSKACRGTSVFDINFFYSAGWLSF